MYLKSLTLKGFKSFADRAHMSFEPGLTVIVGPNGSGKSNISDSILWVLGEQSAKQLRGQAMEDVIFSGSSARKPVGVAEVTLVLDNSDHMLPVDFDEVAITRRMYRSGESEYLINSSPCRLMDIQDILHDSGLGKDTHSIISQGKLDAILQSRPEERRALIEEAAGISKHKRRKERALKKIKSMDEHLTRARDINKEIARQLRPLERQVDRARKYKELSSRANELTQMLAVDELRSLQSQWNDLEIRSKEGAAELELAQYRLGEKERELEKLQVMLEEKGLFVGDLGEQRRHMQDVVGRINSDMRLLEEKGHNMAVDPSAVRHVVVLIVEIVCSIFLDRLQVAAGIDFSFGIIECDAHFFCLTALLDLKTVLFFALPASQIAAALFGNLRLFHHAFKRIGRRLRRIVSAGRKAHAQDERQNEGHRFLCVLHLPSSFIMNLERLALCLHYIGNRAGWARMRENSSRLNG